jgi:Zn-dependent M16 (insulinase) family peptidase
MSEKKENACVVTINWVLPEIKTSLDVLKYALLHDVLIVSNAGVLKNKLLDSKLGERFAGYGLSIEEIMPSLSIGLFGVEEKNLSKVEALIMKTIEDFVATEISPSNLQASINQLEFTLKDPGIMYSEGIDIFGSMLANWLYGRDPLERVMFAKALKELKKQITDDPRFVQRLAKDLLLDNAHRLRLDLLPDPSLEKKLQEEEELRLQSELKGLTAMERKEIKKKDEELREWQGKPDSKKALETLPRLDRVDLNTKVRKVKRKLENKERTRILWHKLPTQDVERVSMRFNISHLDLVELQWLSLANKLLPRLGTRNYTREELAIALDEHTGGMSINLTWLKPYKKDRLDIYQAASFRTLQRSFLIRGSY